MTEFDEKFRQIEQKLSHQNGVFNFFALALRENSVDRYDLIVSATWLNSQDKNCFNLIAREIKNALSEEEMIKVSRIIILLPHDPVLSQIKSAFKVTSGAIVKIQNSIVNNFLIKEMTIFSSQ